MTCAPSNIGLPFSQCTIGLNAGTFCVRVGNTKITMVLVTPSLIRGLITIVSRVQIKNGRMRRLGLLKNDLGKLTLSFRLVN